jgi:lysophospholipase L1-like esterase
MRIIASFRVVLAAAAVGVVFAAWSGMAVAGPVNGSDAHGTYLALGDSVAFGYVPPQAVPAPNYLDAHSFVGYPQYLAQQLHERVSNASCPGETSASLLYAGAQSNGCENSVGSTSGYRTFYPLHVRYQGTQMQYALKYLAAHKHTRLITLNIGANDAFVCQETTADHCSSTSELTQLALEIATNLTTTIRELRGTGYDGPIVVLTYYSLNYADAAQVAATLFLDTVIANATTAAGGTIANGFTAFATASAAYGGDPCAAGLLIRLPGGTCNIHPSAEGQQVLAAAIASTIGP